MIFVFSYVAFRQIGITDGRQFLYIKQVQSFSLTMYMMYTLFAADIPSLYDKLRRAFRSGLAPRIYFYVTVDGSIFRWWLCPMVSTSLLSNIHSSYSILFPFFPFPWTPSLSVFDHTPQTYAWPVLKHLLVTSEENVYSKPCNRAVCFNTGDEFRIIFLQLKI